MSKQLIRALLAMMMASLLLSCSKSEVSEDAVIVESEFDSSSSIDVSTPDSGSTLRPQTSILEIMQLVITPATDVLWGVGNPQTDEEWAVLEQAAVTVIDATNQTSNGGSGPQDMEWTSDPAYQAMNQIMLNAAKASLAAAQARDLDALFVAGDELYAPCEACHLQFNPGVVGQ